MTDLQAIEERRSRRTYSGALSVDQVRKLQALAAGQKLQSGLFIDLIEDGATAFGGITSSYGLFTGVRSLFALACYADNAAAREAAGYHGQRLVLEATKLGLGTCWVGGTFNKQRMASAIRPGTQLIAVITVGPVKEKPGLVERTVRRATGGHRTDWSEIYTAEGEPPEWFLAGARAAFQAPSALNKKPVHFTWKDGSAIASVPIDSSFPWVNLGIAKLHFEIGAGGRFPEGNNAVFEKAGD